MCSTRSIMSMLEEWNWCNQRPKIRGTRGWQQGGTAIAFPKPNCARPRWSPCILMKEGREEVEKSRRRRWKWRFRPSIHPSIHPSPLSDWCVFSLVGGHFPGGCSDMTASMPSLNIIDRKLREPKIEGQARKMASVPGNVMRDTE